MTWCLAKTLRISWNRIINPPANNGYIQGDALPKITNAVIANGFITIQGENFVENDKVYMDGKLLETKPASSSGVSAYLPYGFIGKSSTLEIQVKLSDSIHKVISQSNVYQLPGS